MPTLMSQAHVTKPARWKPPNDPAARDRALGPIAPPLPPLDRCWECFSDLPRPGYSDWLAKGGPGERDRIGQTYKAFARPGPHRAYPSRSQSKIYLVEIGEAAGAPAWDVLACVLAACYGLEVARLTKPLAATALAALARDTDGAGYGAQLETQDALDLLHRHKPRDAFAIVGFTMEDLCDTQKGFGFLFGQACMDKGAGLFSFARYAGDTPALFLRRCAMVLCHETGHLFGIRHCVFAKCLMNGSNHMAEADDRPFALCPVDTRKVADTHAVARLGAGPLDLVAREGAMLDWFVAHGLHDDARLARQRITALGGGDAVAPCAAPSA